MASGADKEKPLADAHERSAAVTELGRTVVVTAGAGTGKTALLVERALNILMLPGRRVPVTDILALTFSNRAAGEMRVRIREALGSFVEWTLAPEGPPPSAGYLGSIYDGILARTKLPAEEISERAALAVASLERASISTMHSFAAQILRRHPVEAGVDPRFREDDGLNFAERFRLEWERFLETELSEAAPRAESWNEVLDELALTDVTELARKLCDEEVPLETLARGAGDGSLFELDGGWLGGLAREARALSAAHPETAAQRIGRAVEAAAEVFEGLREGREPRELERPADHLAEGRVDSKKWERSDVERARILTGIARDLLKTRPEAVAGALKLLVDFARGFRAGFVREGNMSFSALLVRARDLLRDHPRVREHLKRRYGHILVDEFQDTDPVQYEIVFYLAEREGRSARDWRDCELRPGKLFIVGDPKQSIYHFRGADIGAYHEVVTERLAERAAHFSLRTNFRSNGRVISVINGIFETVIREERGVQPAYEALDARPGGEAKLSSQRVDFLLTRAPDGGAFRYAADASEGEARALARWIRDDLLREEIPDAEGGARPIRAGDVAILLRKMTYVGCYTEALDAEGLAYVVEGEKSFYRTQEVTDFLNVLAALSDPHDRRALVGVLRSGAGGLTDADIARLAEAEGLDYTAEGPLPDSLADREGAERLYAVMRELHSEIPRLPVASAIDAVTERLPVVEAAVASGAGERGRANLRKIRRTALEYGSRPEITMREFVSLVRERVEELREEGESPLAEEDAGALRILTIHKAKGLEFPVVIIPGLHVGKRPRPDRVWVRSEWSSGRVGLAVGRAFTPAAVRLAAREAELSGAEERRVLYVGATRAKERLVFSAARAREGSGELMSYLTEAVELPLDSGEPAALPCGPIGLNGEIHFVPLEAPEPAGRRAAGKRGKLPVVSSGERLESWAEGWERRERRFEEAKARRVLVSPSSLAETEAAPDLDTPSTTEAGAVGSVAHAVLELLDFGSPTAESDVDKLVEGGLERLGPEFREERDGIGQDAARMLRRFVAAVKNSSEFAWLRRANVLARELPCLLPWEGGVAGGRIDLVCELDGRLLVIDYKTSRIDAAQAEARAQEYRRQGEMYARAVTLATGRPVDGFRVLFLRPCVGVDVEIG